MRPCLKSILRSWSSVPLAGNQSSACFSGDVSAPSSLNTEWQRRLKACISWEQHRRSLQLSTPNHGQQLQLLDEKMLRGSSCPHSPSWVWSFQPNQNSVSTSLGLIAFKGINLTVTGVNVFPFVAHLSDSQLEMIHLQTQGHSQGIIFGNGQISKHCNNILRSYLSRGRGDA